MYSFVFSKIDKVENSADNAIEMHVMSHNVYSNFGNLPISPDRYG